MTLERCFKIAFYCIAAQIKICKKIRRSKNICGMFSTGNKIDCEDISAVNEQFCNANLNLFKN